MICQHHNDSAQRYPRISKTVELFSRNYYFPGIRKEVEYYISKCQDCQLNKHTTHAPYGRGHHRSKIRQYTSGCGQTHQICTSNTVQRGIYSKIDGLRHLGQSNQISRNPRKHHIGQRQDIQKQFLENIDIRNGYKNQTINYILFSNRWIDRKNEPNSRDLSTALCEL